MKNLFGFLIFGLAWWLYTLNRKQQCNNDLQEQNNQLLEQIRRLQLSPAERAAEDAERRAEDRRRAAEAEAERIREAKLDRRAWILLTVGLAIFLATWGITAIYSDCQSSFMRNHASTAPATYTAPPADWPDKRVEEVTPQATPAATPEPMEHAQQRYEIERARLGITPAAQVRVRRAQLVKVRQ